MSSEYFFYNSEENSKPFKCYLCENRFHTKSQLQRHALIHLSKSIFLVWMNILPISRFSSLFHCYVFQITRKNHSDATLAIWDSFGCLIWKVTNGFTRVSKHYFLTRAFRCKKSNTVCLTIDMLTGCITIWLQLRIVYSKLFSITLWACI